MHALANAWQLAALCFIAGFLLARLVYRRQPEGLAQPRADVDGADIDAEACAGHRVDAMRLMRRKYGCDVRTAKSDLDARRTRLHTR